VAAVLLALLLAGCTTGHHGPSAAAPSASPSRQRTPTPRPANPSPTPTADPVPALDLTAMTFNVLGSNPPRDWFPLSPRRELAASARAPVALAQILTADPDILGLQEFRPSAAAGKRLVAGLEEYSWAVGTARDTAPREAVAVPLLYRTDRFELLASGRERISRRGQGGAYLDRYLVWAELRDRNTGRTLFAFNYHAHPRQSGRYAWVRSHAIDRILEVIRTVNPGLGRPFVVIGDFNARSDETRDVFAAHKTAFAGAGVVDAAAIAEADTSDVPGADSHNRLSAPVAGRDVAKVVRRNGRHIDFVWVPIGTRVTSWATVTGPGVAWRTVRGEQVPVWTGVVSSDHSPVVAELSFPGAPTRPGQRGPG